MGRSASHRPDGDVRFHHPLNGLWVLEARQCAHRWVVFHETYTFSLIAHHGPPAVVRWRYNHRTYQVDPAHPVMVMQPGELHANVDRTPRGNFITVQVDDALMKRIAEQLGWTANTLNINPAYHQSNHPPLLRALRNFRGDLCKTLFACAKSGVCTCGQWRSRHLSNLAELVSVFITDCAERQQRRVLPEKAPALVKRARDYLYEHFQEPFDLEVLARSAGCPHNPCYLDRVFSRELGIGPEQYRNRILVAKACKALLKEPKEKLELVVARVGWPGRPNGPEGADRVQLMNKYFKYTLGVTPGEFRTGSKR